MLSKEKDVEVKRGAQGLNSNRANGDYTEQNLWWELQFAPYLRPFLTARIGVGLKICAHTKVSSKP